MLARLALFLFLILLPWAAPIAFPDWSGHDIARMGQICLGLICASALVARSFDSRLRFTLTPFAKACCLLAAGFAAASCVNAAMPDFAMREVAIWLSGLAIVLSISSDSLPTYESQLSSTIIVAATLYHSLELSVVILCLASNTPLEARNLAQGYNNFRFFNHVQTISLPLLAMAIGCTPPKLAKWGIWGLVSGMALLLFTGGRATTLALIVGMTLSVGMFKSSALIVIRRLALGALLGGVLYAILFLLMPVWLDLPKVLTLADRATDSASGYTRWILWQAALKDITNFPWLGTGPLHFAHRTGMEAGHPHNILLQIGSEWGIPVLLFCMAGTARNFWTLLQRLKMARLSGNTDDLTKGIGFLLCGCAIATDALLSGNFAMPMSAIWIAVYLGWLMRWCKQQRRNDQSTADAWYTRMLVIGIFLSQVWLINAAVGDLRELDLSLRNHETIPIDTQMFPRLWSHGHF